MQKREGDTPIGVLLLVPGLHRHPGPGRLVGRVLIGEESPDLILEPQLVPRPLIIPVDGDDRERLPGSSGSVKTVNSSPPQSCKSTGLSLSFVALTCTAQTSFSVACVSACCITQSMWFVS